MSPTLCYKRSSVTERDSLCCGKATPVATVHRTVAKCRLSNPSLQKSIPKQKAAPLRVLLFVLAEREGFALLRQSHAGCNSPPDCCQVPAFESPSTKIHNKTKETPDWVSLFWRRERDSNPRNLYRVYTISNRAPSTSSAISPWTGLSKPTYLLDLKWWAFRDLNPGPSGYEPDALTN